mgnify:CR=1 FL=1|jgi:predicted  nucleic acid-binding Zn-ribbon protein
MFLFKIFAGMLSTLAIIIGTTFAIPESREYVLNTLAPYSQVYEEQRNINEDLESENLTNQGTIVETEEALAVAEQATNSLQGELLSVQTALTQLTTELALQRENLETTETQLALAETNLNNANLTITELNTNLENLNQQYALLNDELNQVLNSDNQQQINELNLQIQNMQFQIGDLNFQLNDIGMQKNDLEMQVMNYQMEIDNLNQTIWMKDDQCMQLQMQLDTLAQERDALQMEVYNLNQQILQLTENSTYTITQQDTSYTVVAGANNICLSKNNICQIGQLNNLNNYIAQIIKQNNLLLTFVGGNGATYSMIIEHEFLSGNENFYNRSDVNYSVNSSIVFKDLSGNIFDLTAYNDSQNIQIKNVEIASISTYEKTSELITNVGGLNYNGNILQSVDVVVYVAVFG